MPLVTFCNGKGPSRSSRAAQERYSRRGRRALTATAPLSDRRFCGFFSVKADLTGTLYHQGGKMSRAEAVCDALSEKTGMGSQDLFLRRGNGWDIMKKSS